MTCTVCEAVMKAVDESIVDPTNEQVISKDELLSQKVGQGETD